MRIYDGPFDPPPAELLEHAIGWRFVKIQLPGVNRWKPVAWEIIFPSSVLTVDMETQLATRDSILYAPVLKEDA